jgi:hemerythrin
LPENPVAILNWSPSCSIGVAALDEEHRYFFALLNRLYDGVIDGSASNASTSALADEVLAYSIHHCHHEEALLASAHYPALDEIRREHETLRASIEDFRRRLADQGGVSHEMANFLLEWMLQHVLKEDKKIGAFLNAAGIR